MGKRRHLAALGATFALFVAACAASDTPLANAPELAHAPRSSDDSGATSGAPGTAPSSLADASFLAPDTSADPCQADNSAHVSLLSPADGSELWSFPIPEPGAVSAVSETAAFVSFRSNRGQAPGLGALSLETRRPLWQRFFDTETIDLAVTETSLIVVTRESIRALDLETGEDIWINERRFDFNNVILTEGEAYALDAVGVKAIDLATGRVVWTLDDVLRADSLAYTTNTITVASRNRIVAVDIEARGRLWDITNADRVGAGDIWATPDAVFYEVSPSLAPGGGIAALSRDTGEELWSVANVGSPVRVGDEQIITSTASGDLRPGEPFVFVALSASTGAELWRLPSTTQVFDGVVGTNSGQVIISDPHPAAPGFHRVRMVNSATGAVVWQTATQASFDGAQFGQQVDVPTSATLFGTNSLPDGDVGHVSFVVNETEGWTAELTGGVSQPPLLATQGLLTVSPSQFSCIARLVGEPAPVIGSAVLGAATERSNLNR